MTHRRVAVTGLGLVSPHGDTPDTVFDALLRGESAIRLYQPDDALQPLAIPAGLCTTFNPGERLGRARANGMDRFSQLATVAADSAWGDAGLDTHSDLPRDEAGVFWGTGGGGTVVIDRSYRDLFLRNRPRISPVSVVLGMNNAAAANIAMGLGLGGANFTYSVACASSAIAIGEAYRRIRDGESRLMLAGGSEAPLVYGVIRAWESLQVLALGDADAAPGVCRPFHARRSGLVLSEGAAALVLEDWDHAEQRGAKIYAELAGYGTSCDHTHLSRPDPVGQVRALQAAMTDAAMTADEVGYVNAHGTGTHEGDIAEIEAMRRTLGKHAAHTAISATKSMHGHLMGAAGAIEAIVTIMALHRQAIPPTAFLDEVDVNCAGLRHLSKSETASGLKAALSNSFAFGGSNAVLAFRAGMQ